MIDYYKLDGQFVKTEELTQNNIMGTNGMKVRCFLRNGDIIVGYCKAGVDANSSTIEVSCSFNPKIGFGDIVGVNWKQIERMEAILWSGPRWGGRIDFLFDVDSVNEEHV